jgi:hypothetical protein
MNKSVRIRLQSFFQELVFRFDTTKFLVDRPKFDYQPLPWVGITHASIRGKATYERWDGIKKTIPKEAKSLKDIGCCVGFFCHSATEELNLFSLGIDSDARFIRIARHVASQFFSSKNETFLEMQITPHNISMLPVTDVTILFSIWHHWVFDFGLESATQMLQDTWAKTNLIMYFESGEEEIEREFNIDFKGNAKLWLRNYLETQLKESQIEIVGEFQAGSYDHYQVKNHFRTVYAVKKIRE